MISIYKTKNGYTVLELIFYIAFFTALSLVVIDAMLIMARSLKQTTIQAEFAQSGTIMERMSREIRASNSITSVSNSDLILNTKDSGGTNKTVEFSLVASNLLLTENGVLTGNLNSAKISVTNLVFSQISTTKGKAIKILLTVKSKDDISGREENFYDTVVLRGSY